MRVLAVGLAVAALGACADPNNGGVTPSKIEMTQFFSFGEDRQQHWEYVNADPSYTYVLLADMSEVVEETDDGQIFAVDWTKECRSNDPYCISGLLYTIKWRSTQSRGVFIHELDAASGAQQVFDPPIQLALAEMTPDETVQTITGGFTWTSTFLGFEECPIRMNGDWGENCVHLTLDDGDGNPTTNAGLVGDFWGIINYNMVGLQLESDVDVWQMSSWECDGSNC